MGANLDVFLLFFNAALSVALVAGVVVAILRREYLPALRRLELAEPVNSSSEEEAGGDGSRRDGG